MLFNQKTVHDLIFHHLGNPMVLNKTLITSILMLTLVAFSEVRAQNSSLFSPVIQVNDNVITKFEFDQRVKFLSALKFPGNPNEVAQTQLIEERLKQTEALKLKITASETEIEDALKRFSSRAKLSTDEFIAELNRLGIYPNTFRSYVEAEIIWQKIIKKKFVSQSKISDLQLKRATKMANFDETVQVLLTEVILPFSNQDMREIENIANQLKKIKSIEEFSKAAKKYSKAPTAELGGLIKWQNFNKLPEIIKPFIFNLSPGQITEPIKLNTAIALFQLRDIREIGDKNTEANFLDFITVDTTLANLDYLKDIQNKFHNCSDLTAAVGDQTDIKLTRSKLFSEQLPNSLATVLEKLDPNEAEIIINYEKPKLVRLCERNKKEKLANERIENYKNNLQTLRLKYLARSFMETLKDNARIVTK